jgi:hypothetical protein
MYTAILFRFSALTFLQEEDDAETCTGVQEREFDIN